jgi:hypothetical protein
MMALISNAAYVINLVMCFKIFFHCPVAGSCEHDSEPSGSIRGEEFLHELSDCSILKKNSTPIHGSAYITVFVVVFTQLWFTESLLKGYCFIFVKLTVEKLQYFAYDYFV